MPHARAATRQASLVRPILLAALALTLLPLLVAAQDAPVPAAAKAPSSGIARKGFYLSAGLGRGQQRFDEDLGGGSSQAFTEGGAAATLRIGGMLSPKVALSLDIFGFVPENGGGKDGTGGLFATATFFPKKGGGFLLRGGLGQLRTDVETSGSFVFTNVSTALQFGAGYDLRIGRNKAVSFALDVLQGVKKDGLTERFGTLGAAISFY